MVPGIETFKTFFAAFPDQYTLIGGAACDLLFEDAGLPYRATKDLDIVLSIEAIDPAFCQRFAEFLNAGGYEARERHVNDDVPHRELYRFHKPTDAQFPFMIELFCRQPDLIELPDDAGIVRLPLDDDSVSLSAILLDNDYYDALLESRRTLGGVVLLDATMLIPFKAHAYLDLTAKRGANLESAKMDDIRKHRNDVMRLSQLLIRGVHVPLSPALHGDMKAFVEDIEGNEPLNVHAMKIAIPFEDIMTLLREIYQIA